MAAKKETSSTGSNKDDAARSKRAGQEPEWSEGLRKLYDSVVEEPLPDSFKDLLSKLDESQTGDKN